MKSKLMVCDEQRGERLKEGDRKEIGELKNGVEHGTKSEARKKVSHGMLGKKAMVSHEWTSAQLVLRYDTTYQVNQSLSSPLLCRL